MNNNAGMAIIIFDMRFLHYMKLTLFGKLIIDIPFIRPFIRPFIIISMIVLPSPDDVSTLGLIVFATRGQANGKQGQQHDHQ